MIEYHLECHVEYHSGNELFTLQFKENRFYDHDLAY